MNIKGREIKVNKKILIVIGVIAVITIGFIGKGNSEEKRIIDNTIKAIEDRDYEYARSALSSVVDGNNKKIDKLWNIVTSYQNASDEFYSNNNIDKAKQYLDNINKEYKNYSTLKEDVEKLQADVKEREDYIVQVDKLIKEIESLISNRDYEVYKKAQKMTSVKDYYNLPESQRKKLDELDKRINDELFVLRAEEDKKEKDQNSVQASMNGNGSKAKYIQKLDDIEVGFSDLDHLYNSGITSDMNKAESTKYKKWDDALNEIYNDIRNTILDSEMKVLTEKQGEWIKYRDTTAKKEASSVGGGFMSEVQYNSTLTKLTKERCYELVNTYMK